MQVATGQWERLEMAHELKMNSIRRSTNIIFLNNNVAEMKKMGETALQLSTIQESTTSNQHQLSNEITNKIGLRQIYLCKADIRTLDAKCNLLKSISQNKKLV